MSARSPIQSGSHMHLGQCRAEHSSSAKHMKRKFQGRKGVNLGEMIPQSHTSFQPCPVCCWTWEDRRSTSGTGSGTPPAIGTILLGPGRSTFCFSAERLLASPCYGTVWLDTDQKGSPVRVSSTVMTTKSLETAELWLGDGIPWGGSKSSAPTRCLGSPSVCCGDGLRNQKK